MKTTSEWVVTAPVSQALSLSDAKAHLRVMDDTNDTEILRFIDVATRWLEEGLGITLINTSRGILTDSFPSGWGMIELPRPPLVSIDSFQYYDADNAQQTLVEDTDFTVVTSEKTRGYVYPILTAWPNGWPTTYNRPDAVDLRFTAGYGATNTSVPEEAKHILRMMIAQFDEHRSATVEGRISTEIKIAMQSLRQALGHGFYAGVT